MNIGFFTDTYFPQLNGVTYAVSQWKAELERRNHKVFVFYPEGDYSPKEGEISSISVDFPYYDEYRIGLPNIIKMRKIAKKLDVIHLHGTFSMALAGVGFSKRYDIPCVITYHTPIDLYLDYITKNSYAKEALKLAYKKYERVLIEQCSIITVPSETTKREMEKEGYKDIVVISNGVDTRTFHEADPTRFKAEHKIGSGRVIGYTGRNSYEKHLEDLIEFSDRFDGTILIGGKGPAQDYFRKLARSKKNVRFLGFLERSRMAEFYSALDLFVIPSVVETQGMVVLEANCCGTPAIGADSLALKDTIESGVNGYRYKQGDIDDLERVIGKAYSNMEKLKRGCEKKTKEHSLEAVGERLIGLYESLLK